jgi:hypothetical protein
MQIGQIVALQRVWRAVPHVFLVAALAPPIATGCRVRNCAVIVGDRCTDIPPEGESCMTSNDCASPSGVCDIAGTGQCVQCTPDHAAACTASTPVCGSDRRCRACVAHSECSLSHVCLPDGTCAAERDIAYVDPDGTDNTDCFQSKACVRVAAALATQRPYVKFHGTIDESVIVNHRRSVTFLADLGATLTWTGGGSQPVLTVQDDGTSLAVYDLTIADALDTTTVGVEIPPDSGDPSLTLMRVTIANNPGGGIVVSGGRLWLAQSFVRDNLGGGIIVSSPASFEIIGNVFIDNGATTSPVGAIAISTVAATTNRLDFNSVYRNASQDGIGAAIRCVAGPFTARDNILYQNGNTMNHEQVSGTCAHEYSLVQPGTLPPGTGNLAADPLFQDARGGNLHLQPGTPVRTADPGPDLTGLAAQDLDGHSRLRPATLGAYQLP